MNSTAVPYCTVRSLDGVDSRSVDVASEALPLPNNLVLPKVSSCGNYAAAPQNCEEMTRNSGRRSPSFTITRISACGTVGKQRRCHDSGQADDAAICQPLHGSFVVAAVPW